jgi:zinc transport system substrate-binding protein
MIKLLTTVALSSLVTIAPALAQPAVVASTKPIHSLVASVMAGVGEPGLIVKGAASPHTYSLRPSDASALEGADIVFWTGHGLELFLAQALETLSTKAQTVELAKTPGLTLLPMREGGAFEAHVHDDHAHEEAHDHEEHDHDDEAHDHDAGHGESDMHFWLDPENAKLMVGEIASVLSTADPDNAARYAENAATTIADLSALETELEAELAGISGKSFIVFHDAYQYFEARFGLAVAGTVTVSPEAMPGASRINELRGKVVEVGATCVFAEPNFEPAIVSTIVEGTEAKAGVLDPEGSALAEGPALYGNLLRGIADGLLDCLG